MRETLLRWARFVDIDQAIFVCLSNRMWTLIAGPISLVLIGSYFSPEAQGYYYTFASLLALQVFLELGIGGVVQQFASHEWAKLKRVGIGQVLEYSVALERLTSIAFFSFKWFVASGLIASVGLSYGGYLFFSSSPDVGVSWQAPWITLAILTGCVIFLQCFWSILEGCNQILSLYKFRLYQSILSQSLGWIALILGAELWVPTIVTTVTILCSLYYLGRFQREFLGSVFKKHVNSLGTGLWLHEILPLQWRIAVTWIGGCLCFSLFVPILFKFHGAEVAGQMGMTWSLIAVINTIASAWIAPRVPQFAMAASNKDYQQLDQLFRRTFRASILIACVLAMVILFMVLLLNSTDVELASKISGRLFPPSVVAIFLAAQLLQNISAPFSSYMRAHKQEPLFVLTIFAALLVNLSNFTLGKSYAGLGVALGYLGTQIIVNPLVIYIWYLRRREWMNRPGC